MGDKMSAMLNRRGFTLVELLAVLVILSAIMGIALPSITSSMERSKDKQNKSKQNMLESFAEIYVADHKNAIYNYLDKKAISKCYISIKTLKDKGYLSDEADLDSDGKEIEGYIIFNRQDNSYLYKDSMDNNGSCLE